MKMKKCLSILLAIVMIATMITSLPITANAVDVDTAATAEATVYEVGTPEELLSTCNVINSAGAGEYVVKLTADIDSAIGGLSFKEPGVNVTVIGNDHYLACSSGQNVQAWGGASVTLGDGITGLTLIGDMSGEGNSNPGAFYIVDPDSVGIMNDKVTIKDNMTNNHLGAGVNVQSGTFIMNGGTIENCGVNGGSVCYGGGVSVINGARFEMNGGTIKDCYVESSGKNWLYPWVAGGGVFVARADFTMNGGTIENCTATNFASSAKKDAIGGGIAVVTSLEAYYENNNWGYLDSNFTMNGGTIKDCSSTIGGGALAAGMAYCDIRQQCTHYYGVLDGSDNPGIYLNGGSMNGNYASAGGAIFLNWIRPNVDIKNMTILSNTADEGGAIYVMDAYTHAQIENCTITNNHAEEGGGAIMLNTNIESNGTHIKDTTITGNTSGDRGAGVFYNADSILTISGANIIQDNTYDEALNNLNIYKEDDTVYPVYVDGDLTGSQIGLSDPTLWDDNLSDEDAQAVSTDYLTSGYKAYNTANPSNFFTSDHETWVADYSDVNPNEVRLVRKETVDYHINNDVIDDEYGNSDIFTDEIEAVGTTVNVDETIDEFYTVPEVVPTAQNSCPYIFKGWYYDKDNDDDSHPVVFGTDTYTAGRDIYAHWITVDNVDKDSKDEYSLPQGYTQYGGFDLMGIQIREGVIDTNYGSVKMPGGMRFITSLSTKVVDEINALDDDTDIEYGYVAATDTNKGWINYHNANSHKLQYVSTSANGINTLNPEPESDETYFGFARNVNCTSKESNKSNSNSNYVAKDHRRYGGYLLYTLVVTYEGATAADKAKNILARPYIHYTDANGLERVAYSEYNGGSNKLGGCYTNYDSVVKISL